MRSIRIELDTVTPLFLSGADQHKSPRNRERQPSVGALRYWLRESIIGGQQCYEDPQVVAAQA